MVTGEYGEEGKRPHWHALLFNYAPHDAKEDRKTDRGEQVWKSEFLTSLWKKGRVEFGSVTLESANYVARYAAKKLVHGKDEDHRFHPLHKTSSKNAIGRSWIEMNWEFTFKHGYVVLADGNTCAIPRYYIDWFKKQMPNHYARYVTEIRPQIMEVAEKKARKDELEWFSTLLNRRPGAAYPLTKSKVELTILESKFKLLQERLKL